MLKRSVSLILAISMLMTLFLSVPGIVGAANGTQTPDLTNAIVVSNPTSATAAADRDPNFTLINRYKNDITSDSIKAAGTADARVLDSASPVGADGTYPIAFARYPGDNNGAAGAKYYINKTATDDKTTHKPGDYEVWYYNVNNVEQYRDTADNAKQDGGVLLEVSSTPYEKGMSADAELSSLGTVVDRKWINQKTASGNTSGWVKIGTYHFRGDQYENVTIKKANYGINEGRYNETYTYASKIAFVPVEKKGSTGLNLHIKRGIGISLTSIMRETVRVTDSHYTVTIPAEEVGRGESGALEDLKVLYWAEDSEATVQVGIGDDSKGPDYYETIYDEQKRTWYHTIKSFTYGTTQRFNFKVTASDGAVKDYYITVKVDGASDDTYYGFMPSTTAQNPLSTGVVSESLVNGGTSFRASEFTNAEYTLPHELIKAGTGRYTSSLSAFGDTVTWTPKTAENENIPSGYYSAYVYATYNLNKADEYLGMAINHAGMRDQKTLNIAKYEYHSTDFDEDRMWVYAGNYYFDGTGNENISVSKISDYSGSSVLLSGIKLVKSSPDGCEKNFAGLSVTANGVSEGFSAKAMEGNSYVLPLTSKIKPNADSPTLDDVALTVRTTNKARFDEIYINGEKLSADSSGEYVYNIARMGNAMNSYNIVFKKDGATIENYDIEIFVPYGTNGGYVARGLMSSDIANSGWLSELNLPVNYAQDRQGRIITQGKVAQMSRLKTWTSSGVDTAKGAWRVVMYRPDFEQKFNSSDTTMKDYTADKITVKITDGYGTTHTKELNWNLGTSGWVDLGTYAFSATANELIEVQSPTGSQNIMVDQCLLLKEDSSGGVLADDELIAWNKLGGYVYDTAAGSVTLKPFPDGEAAITVGGESVAAGSGKSIAIDDISITPVSVSNAGAEYELILTKGLANADGGIASENFIQTSGDNTGAKAYVYNNSITPEEYTLFLAVYVKNGDNSYELEKIETVNEKINVNDGVAVIDTTGIKVDEGRVVKAMLWTKSSNSPLNNAKIQ